MPGERRRREFVNDIYIVTHVVDDAHDGWRTDHYLKTCYPRQSRAALQKSIDDGSVVLSKRIRGEMPRLKASSVLQAGDELQILTTPDRQEPNVDFGYKVLFEDDDVLVIDKPGNLPVHPAGRFFFNTLLMKLRTDRAEELKKGRDFYLVHRIDRETSGILLMAKKSEIARDLVAQFFDHKTVKKYYAIVKAPLEHDEFSIDKPLANDPNSPVRLKMATCEYGEGQTALTNFRVLKRGTKHVLLEALPKTGRQHQIRVHLSSIGNPIVGDKLYGGREDLFYDLIEGRIERDVVSEALGFPRHALHNCFIKFRHPVLKQDMEIHSDLPSDMQGLIDA